MSELSKFINLTIEYGQKVQSSLNKKYRQFIRSICNLQQLARTVDAQNIHLTHEFIIFKLGLQAKSTKAIEVSLLYLQKFFSNKFIDLGQPNYCEQYEIDETTVRRKENIVPKGQMRVQLLRLLQPLVHFKSQEINLLLIKVYQYLITQPISATLIQLNLLTPNTQLGQKIMFNYYSYRFYIYQEVYTFTEKQFRSINPLCIRNQKINAQIQQAFVNHQELLDLIHKYVGEMVTAVVGGGGKYGLCVICKQPADYYCKITKASLCGTDCKKRHLELAEKQYKLYYQAVHLWTEIKESFQLLLQTLAAKQSRSLLSVLVALLQKPHLFMLVKGQFRLMIGKHVTGVVNMALQYKDQQAFQSTYTLIAMLCRYWMLQSLSSIEYFFKECALKILQDKRPNFKLLIGLFKALAKVFQYGKTTIQLYINFDCQYNRTNVVERIMFQLSKICQDKFSSTLYYNKHQKTSIKNGAVTLLTILVKGLSEYRLLYSQRIHSVQDQILQLKQRKTSLEKFIHKFNQHWSEGLKMLFNMNMVGLESHVQIVEILLTTKGLNKGKVEEMLLNSKEYLDVLFEKIISTGPFMGLVELFRLVPLKKSSLLLKHYSDFVLTKMLTSCKDQNDSREQYSVTKWAAFLTTAYQLKQLQKYLQLQHITFQGTIDHIYMKCLQTRNDLTLGTHKTYFRHCISHSYIKVLEPQLSLLQIPLLYLLETSYPHDKVFELVTELVQVCPHASWVGLSLKNIDMQKLIKDKKYTMEDHSLVVSCLKQCKVHAQFINQWQAILQFVSRLYKVINSQPTKKLTAVSTTPTVLLQQPLRTREELSILQLEEYLLMIGENCDHNFANFVIAMIHLSEEDLQKENVFFLQKTFEILQQNLGKLVLRFDQIVGEFEDMLKRIVRCNLAVKTRENEIEDKKQEKMSLSPFKHSTHKTTLSPIPYSAQTLIYISDMLKQLFAKVLKHLSSTSTSLSLSPVNQKIQLQFFKLFGLILQCHNKQASDFVMNSISMVIMVHNKFYQSSWTFIVSHILKEYVKEYRQQTLTILQKVLKEGLKSCQHLEFQIINLTIDLVDQNQVKISIESLHLMKDLVDLMVKQCEDRQKIEEESYNNVEQRGKAQVENQLMRQEQGNKRQGEEEQNEEIREQPQIMQRSQSEEMMEQKMEESSSSQSDEIISTSPRKIKQYILLIISNLIQFITYQCHQNAIQILFILMKTKLPSHSTHSSMSLLFSPEQITQIINTIFTKLQSLPKELLSRGQKIMNESLFWSVKNNNFPIVKNLQHCIIDKFSAMSYTAMKCIRTFVSMTNPKKSQEWDPIEQTLVKILANTHLSDLLNKGNKHTQHLDIQHLISNNIHLNQSHTSQISLSQLSNKLIIQRMTVQVLPNDVKIIDELLKIYQQTVGFNDDIYLRCMLWREGLGVNNLQGPPDILSLEELISYRIISTYYWSKQYEKIADFTLRIISQYCQVSRKWELLQQQSQQLQQTASNQAFQLYSLTKDYWLKRRQPLKVIINYMLPKLPKICKDYLYKEKLLDGIIQAMKFSHQRPQYVETIRLMTIVR